MISMKRLALIVSLLEFFHPMVPIEATVEHVDVDGSCTTTKNNQETRYEMKKTAIHMTQAFLGLKVRLDELEDGLNDIFLVLNKTFTPAEVDEILEESKHLKEEEEEEQEIDVGFGDRLIKDMTKTIHDRDCMERVFDASSPDFSAEEATNIFKKCKLLVLRNAFDKEFLNKFRDGVKDYHVGLNSKRYSQFGITTNGDPKHLQSLAPKRWEVVLPRRLAHRKVLANEHAMKILTDDRILGDHITLHSFGTALSEPGSNSQWWHKDEGYIYMDRLNKHFGLGGHDLPAYVVTMMVPMLDIKMDHGPTEFCMGTSNLDGLDGGFQVYNKSLIANGSAYDEFERFSDKDSCPPDHWRTPKLNFGDMLLFDYQLKHRGGPNVSNDTRVVLYNTYSRYWFKDRNFLSEEEDDSDFVLEGEEVEEDYNTEEDITQYLKPTRLAIPDPHDEEIESWDESKDAIENMEDITDFLPPLTDLELDNESTAKKITFIVSNKDVVDEGTHLFHNGVDMGDCNAGEGLVLTAYPDDEMEFRSLSGTVYKKWTVTQEQQQVVIEDPRMM